MHKMGGRGISRNRFRRFISVTYQLNMALTFLIERYSLRDLKSQVTDDHLEKISRSCCGWKRLPSHLNMESVIVNDIDHLAIDEDEKRLKFLQTWKRAKGSDATYEELINALLKIGCLKDAESVCRILEREVTSGARLKPPQNIGMDN